MVGDKEIIKINSHGIIRIPSFITVNPNDILYFRRDYYNNTKFIIIDHENLCKIRDLFKKLYEEKRKINFVEYTKIMRYIFSEINDSKCTEDRTIKFPFKTQEKEFKCEEIHTSIKKFILTPIKK